MKRLFITIALVALWQTSFASYSFSAVAPSGQTLYYSYNNGSSGSSVMVTYPSYNTSPAWGNYTKPTGSLIIPDSVTNNGHTYTVTSISDVAFGGCSGLTSVSISNSVTSIGNSAFAGCSGLTSVTIGNSVTLIGSYAFSGCSGLTSVQFNAENCGDFYSSNHPFNNCPNISNFTFGDDVQVIPRFCCYFMTGLTSVTIGDSVTSIGQSAFSLCSGLTSVIISNSVNIIGDSVFKGCSALNSIIIPNSVTSIGNYAFSGCSGLTSVIIGDSVTNIGRFAFYMCRGLISVTIGERVSYIDYDAFTGINSNASVYMRPTVSPFMWNAFGGTYLIYIPCGTYNSYHRPDGIWDPDEAFYNYNNRLRYTYPNFNIGLSVNDSNKGQALVVLQENHAVYCDSTAIIQATSSYGYHFDHWSNGHTANPDTLQLVNDSTVMAIFVPDTFLVHATVNYSNRGVATVSDSLVAYLDSVDISATANYGYHFTRWNDNDTHAMRRVRVTQNTTYTAQFDYNQYQLTLNVDNPVHGSVSNGGTYNYLSVRTISATANYGYHFDHWSDGDTNNTRTIVLTQDTSLTAYFANNQYAVIGIPNNSTYGTVSGSDTVDYLDTVVLTATANTNYYFSRWSDGITVNPRAIVASGNHTVTAYFNPVQFTLMVASCDTSMGRVSGGGNYNYLSSRTISAIANNGYHFTQWNDGVTSQTRTITLTQDTSFTAFFAPNQYTLTLLNANPDMGSVEGGGAYYYHDTVIISATAVEHHHFVQWSDGNRDNPRQYLITGDATLTANFAIDTHTVNISANDIARGSVSSTGTRFVYGTPCTVTATAYTGYTFVKWSNGVTANPYTFAVMNDMELTAIFLSPDEMCTVTVVSANPSMGAATVDGSSSTTVMSGEEVTLTATPYAGYRFVQWQDNDTHSHRTVTVTSTITYTAYFAPLAGIREADDDNGFRVFAQGGQIVVEDAGEMPVMLYDATGRLLATRKSEEMHGGTPLRLDVPASGTYLIKVGNYPARKVVVIR